MRTEADGDVSVSRESATGKVGFIRVRDAASDLFPDVAGDSKSEAIDKAEAYLDRFGSAFGAADGQLERTEVSQTPIGRTVSYTQQYRGVEVFGSMIRANLDRSGDLTSVNGYAAPDLDLSVDPRISAATAGKRAVSTVQVRPGPERRWRQREHIWSARPSTPSWSSTGWAL